MRAKVGLWVYGSHWTGWTVRHTDRDGGVTERKTTKYGRVEVWEGKHPLHMLQTETDDVVNADEMVAMD